MAVARAIFNTVEEVTPGVVPNADTDVIAQDAWICSITLTNIGAVTATITITDKQGTPVPVIKDFPVDPGVPAIFGWPQEGAAYMKGGIKWVTSAADTIVARMRFKY
jgi:hypothetical protein